VVDQFYASALVLLVDGKMKAVILSADLIGIAQQFVKSIRTCIESKTGIEKKNILISASHTHSSPLAAFYTSCQIDKVEGEANSCCSRCREEYGQCLRHVFASGPTLACFGCGTAKKRCTAGKN
jgi:hypothetical protein